MDGPQPVARKAPNGFGLYDMHGNVWEWVADCWQDDKAAADGGQAAIDACPHGLRGGSWNSRPHHLPCAYRLPFATVDRLDVVGFRVVCAAPSL